MFVFPVADIVYALKESNLPGKVIVLLLFVGSIFVWSLMITKLRELIGARKAASRFIYEYRKEKYPVSFFLKKKDMSGSPLHEIYRSGCLELAALLESRGGDREDFLTGKSGVAGIRLEEKEFRKIRNSAEREAADQSLSLESNMGFLATATTTAPFLGLLGTVWGVMESFGGMASAGGSTLSAVAPGISGALMTTVVGLLVALPSAIGYNMLSDGIRRITVLMDNFVEEFVSDMELHYITE